MPNLNSRLAEIQHLIAVDHPAHKPLAQLIADLNADLSCSLISIHQGHLRKLTMAAYPNAFKIPPRTVISPESARLLRFSDLRPGANADVRAELALIDSLSVQQLQTVANLTGKDLNRLKLGLWACLEMAWTKYLATTLGRHPITSEEHLVRRKIIDNLRVPHTQPDDSALHPDYPTRYPDILRAHVWIPVLNGTLMPILDSLSVMHTNFPTTKGCNRGLAQYIERVQHAYCPPNDT